MAISNRAAEADSYAARRAMVSTPAPEERDGIAEQAVDDRNMSPAACFAIPLHMGRFTRCWQTDL